MLSALRAWTLPDIFFTRRRHAAFQRSSDAHRIDDRLKALGIELPTPSTPGANYVQFVRGEAGRHWPPHPHGGRGQRAALWRRRRGWRNCRNPV